MHFQQEPHKLLAIPGPIEVLDEVLASNALPPVSHVDPNFIQTFGDCIRITRDILFTKDAQPFLIAGSGTLGWDQVAVNLLEPNESALVLHSGYFGNSFKDCLETYGAQVDELIAEIGLPVELDRVETALQSKQYKILTFTHVDTSTGVLSDARAICDIVKRVSPSTLVVMDAVCAVASEEIRMDDWGIDVVVSAGQKGLGIPPGLSIVVASQKAIRVHETREAPIFSYYCSWKNWLPIMKAYEEGKAAYFATPPVNLIQAYSASIRHMTQLSQSMSSRFYLHKAAAGRVRKLAKELGLKLVPQKEEYAANGMTAIYYPDGLTAADILPRMSSKGVSIAGGLHTAIKDKYFRIGHMGVTAVDGRRGDMDRILRALRTSIQEAKEAQRAQNATVRL